MFILVVLCYFKTYHRRVITISVYNFLLLRIIQNKRYYYINVRLRKEHAYIVPLRKRIVFIALAEVFFIDVFPDKLVICSVCSVYGN